MVMVSGNGREAILHGTRITRGEEKPLGPFELDGETVKALGEEDIGVFVGSSPAKRRLMRLMTVIDESEMDGTVVVVPSGKELASDLKAHFEDPDDPFPDAVSAPKTWRSSRVAFAVPEGLGDLKTTLQAEGEAVVAVFVVDPYCSIHKHRGFKSKRDFHVDHDRPQFLRDFRDDFSIDDWRPPLVFFVDKPAMSCNIQPMQIPYGLESFWYVRGGTIAA